MCLLLHIWNRADHNIVILRGSTLGTHLVITFPHTTKVASLFLSRHRVHRPYHVVRAPPSPCMRPDSSGELMAHHQHRYPTHRRLCSHDRTKKNHLSLSSILCIVPAGFPTWGTKNPTSQVYWQSFQSQTMWTASPAIATETGRILLKMLV